MIKLCKVCGQYKEESEFPIHSAGRLRSTCKECWKEKNKEDPEKHRERSRRYYQEHKKEIIERTTKWAKDNKEKRRKIVKEMRERRYKEFLKFKESLSCIICGENDPACLDFHHLDESKKEYQISDLVLSKEKMKEELKKCVPICANCHRKVHYYGIDKYPQVIEASKNIENKFEEQ